MTTTAGGGRAGERWGWLGVAVPALLAYVPLLLTQPGQVGADTKTYLYLDPSRLLSDAPYLWDAGIGTGTITHQNIGYLWPMGPFYWFFEQIGSPDWVAQRLWLGTVMFAAAMGVRYLLRTLGWRDNGVLIASLAYMLSPYLLDYSARISVILLPWAGLGWLIAFTIKAIREGGWRWPALFALTVLTVGGINATALLMIAPGPALWFVWAIWVEREASARTALAALGRMAVLTLATSLWWMAGLWAQGRYGLPVLRFTESYRTVAEASTAPEVLRGFGYWFFYGRDKLGPWIEPNVEYTSRTLLLGLSYLIPTLALVSAAVVRWRHRAYFLTLVVVGALMAIGSHPWDDSSPLGWLFKMFTRTDAGLALRSTPRALPLAVLGLSVCLGAGVSALSRRVPQRAMVLTGVVGLLLVVNLPPLWNGTMIAENLKRPEEVPDYWLEAAEHLDAADHGTRVLEIPGTEFASYRWGNTVDPITPGLIDRPYVARELFAYGTPPSQALLIALDRRLHEDVFDTDALAPVARLLSVGDVVLRSDLQFERYRTARPRPTWEVMRRVVGLGPPVTFGEPEPNIAVEEQPLLDEVTLALPLDLDDPPPVAVFPIDDPLGIIRAESADRPLTLAGGPEGIVDAAGMGLLARGQPIFYAASFWDDAESLDQLLDERADLLVTDTNRKQARRWGALQQNTGYTERADEEPAEYDPSDNRLEVFPGAPSSAYTVSEQRGDAIVTATDYGNPVTYTPDDRPANALDGDLDTAWRVGAFSDVEGERLIIELDEPVTTGEITLVQPQTGIVNRVITQGRFHFDGEPGETFGLTPQSEEATGQTITFPERTFQRLEVEVLDTNIGKRVRYDGVSAVGFAEVGVGDARIEEVLRPPTDLLDAAGEASLEHRLEYLFTRLRSNPSEPVRLDEEVAIRRVLDLPTGRSFSLEATARLSAYVPDDALDELVGLPGAEDGGITATSSARLPGSPANRAIAAVDGDPTTFWSPTFEKQQGHYLEVTFPEPVTFDHLDLDLVADGRHSVPTRIFLQADGQEAVTTVEIPPIDDLDEPNATVEHRAEFEPITATTLRVALDGVRDVETIDWHSGLDIIMPVGIAELGIPGVEAGDPPEAFDSGCRDDLLSIDGEPVPVQVFGTTADALALEPLGAVLCRTDEVAVDEGEHILRTGVGRDVGIDIDQLVLSSAEGGGPLPPDDRADVDRPEPPAVDVVDTSRVDATVEIADADEPFWLVLGQSHSEGWTATVEGGDDLGPPTLIDGYANGWRIDPSATGSDLTVHLEWTPQRVIWWAIWASVVGVVACVALLVVGGRRRRPTAEVPVADADPPALTWPPFAESGPRFSTRTAVLATAAVAVFVVLNSPPPALIAVPAAAVTYAAFRWARGRTLQAAVAAGTLAVTGLYYVAAQVRYRHPPDFIWPQQFDAAHVFGLLVIFLLAGEALRSVLITWKEGRGNTIGAEGAEGRTDGETGPPPPGDEGPT